MIPNFTLQHQKTFSVRRGLLLGLSIKLVTLAPIAQAQLPSFPGAEGAGKYTSGGRGTAAAATTVFEVTNLSDDGQPGSLRYAVTQPATYRTVVFRVSGTIHLLADLRLNRVNTTIAGQTAPGDGICIADYPVSLNADNIIIRFVRFRLGDKNQNQGMVNGSGDDDAFGGIGYRKIMIDHCTMSWSADEACTVYRGDSTTLQWNLISEPLDYSYHFETGDTDFERHGYGGIWGGRHASMHHNLLAHMRGRMPRFDGSRNLSPNTAGQENVDFRNNVLYNWASYNVNGGEGGNYNVVNNYYKYGPSTTTGSSGGVAIRSEVINPYKLTSGSNPLPYGKYYLTGNYVDGYPATTARNWLGAVMNGGTRADTTSAKATAPFATVELPVQSAEDAYMAVLQKAGCILPVRDALDQRIVNDVLNRTGGLIDVQGGFPHGTPYSTSQVAWPELTSLPAPTDTDHDGMPNTWETSMGLNPEDATDRNTRGANGYTMLENYLNGLTATVLAVATASPAAEQLQAYPNPAQHELTLVHPVASRSASLTIYSFDGRKIFTLPATVGARETHVRTANLARGSYLILYTDAQQRITVKFSKD